MSDEQEATPEANDPKPIRIGKRSLFAPSEAVAVEQHSKSYRSIAAASQSKAILSNRSPIPPMP